MFVCCMCCESMCEKICGRYVVEQVDVLFEELKFLIETLDGLMLGSMLV